MKKLPRSILCTLYCLVIACLIAPESQADTARFTIIDAREGLTPEVMAAYSEAIGASANTPYLKRRVKVLASGKHGFSPDPVSLPDTVRAVDIDVTLMLHRNSSAHAPIRLNQFNLTRRVPHRLKQTSQIIGY